MSVDGYLDGHAAGVTEGFNYGMRLADEMIASAKTPEGRAALAALRQKLVAESDRRYPNREARPDGSTSSPR